MRKSSILKKLLFNFTIVILITGGSFLIFSSEIVKSHYINSLTKDLEQISKVVSSSFSFLKDKESVRNFVDGLKLTKGYRITIISRDGVVLGDSEKNPEEMENHKNRPEVIKALKGEVGKSIRYSKTTGEKMLYVAVPIKKNGEIIGVARASVFMKSVYELLNILKIRLIFSIIISSILALILSYLFSRGIVVPIKELVNLSKMVSKGELPISRIPERRDEIGELMENMNIMAKRIHELVKNIKGESKMLDAIIGSIDEGVLLLDEDGRIKHINKKTKNFFGMKEEEDRYYWEVIKSDALRKFIKDALKREFLRETLKINGKTLLLTSKKIKMMDRTIITFYDMTEIKNYEKMKKDFVANLSHELKTPLTSIKGFVEVMKEEKSLKYLSFVERNIDRLINIVKDLQTLSKLEYEETKLDKKLFDAVKILKNVEKLFYKKAKDKGLNLFFNLSEKPFYINVDPYLFEEMLINLVDNGIRYTDKGFVEVNLYRKDKGFIVEVKDTGIGIPKEHLDRIFERFYVVDRSRSKRTGGTGLGLSIVKHIVMLHGGDIEVESEVGKGTKFKIFIPS